MELNECIICFKSLKMNMYMSYSNVIIKIICIKCIYELDKCPLCRAPRKTSVHISVIIVQCQQFHSVCFYFSICVYVILVMLILDGYEKVKYMINDKILYNDTYALDYI